MRITKADLKRQVDKAHTEVAGLKKQVGIFNDQHERRVKANELVSLQLDDANDKNKLLMIEAEGMRRCIVTLQRCADIACDYAEALKSHDL